MQRLAAALCIAAVVMGCGPATPPKYRVEGKVTLDKAPVPNAQLIFEPDDRTQGASSAQTDDDGTYDVDLRADGYTVRILAQKSVPATAKMIGPSGAPVTTMSIDIIPPKYNAKSELRRTVEGPEEMHFELSSK